MTGFETYDATGKLTFSTRDSTYLVVRTKVIPGISNHTSTKIHMVDFTLPKEFTDVKVTMYPTTTLHPSTGATMPRLSHTLLPSSNRLRVWATVRQETDRTYPPCVLAILGN